MTCFSLITIGMSMNSRISHTRRKQCRHSPAAHMPLEPLMHPCPWCQHTHLQPATAILTAVSAMSRLSLMATCGQCSAAALSTPCTSGSM
jgi:hypothetical protein